MAGRRAGSGRWGYGVVAITAVMLAVPVALVAASPSLATVPAPPPAAPTVPPLPASQAGAPANLDGIVARGPFIASGFTDARSEDAATEVRALDPRDGTAARHAFVDAWYAMPSSDPSQSAQYADWLMSGPLELNTNPPSQADDAFEIYTIDDNNASRMANAAVALFVLGVTQMDGAAVTDQSVGGGEDLERNAVELLRHAWQVFSPTSPGFLETLSLDLAYLTPLVPDFDGPGIDALEAWLQTHPSDATVRYLLGELLARGLTRMPVYGGATPPPAPPPPLDAALAVIRPLEHDTHTAALGWSAEGDADMLAAERANQQTPYLARRHARDALAAYDSAIRLNRDPGLLAGRAVALDFLGDERDAVAAQQRAVDAAPQSASGLIQLASLQEKLCDTATPCDEAAAEHSAQAAMDMAARAAPPRLDASRFPLWREPCVIDGYPEVVWANDPGFDRGYLGWSYGSLSDRFPVMHAASGCGGGGAFFLTYALIPTSNDEGVDDRRANGVMLDTAAALAIQADALRGAPQDADSVYQAWRDDVAGPLLGATDGTTVWTGRRHLMESYDEAAHLIATPAAATPSGDVHRWPQSLYVADSILRHAGRFRLDARVCEASVAALADNWYPAKCEGEADFLAGDAAAAQPVFATLYDKLRAEGRDEGLADDLLAADVRLHRYAAARSVIDGAKGDEAVADEKLGELAVDTGDMSAATTDFTKALQWYQPGEPPTLAVEAALSDRGIARLRSLQPAAETLPDCTAHRDACVSARADFTAALQLDPDNAVFLLNLAWTSRLLDFPPQVTETELRDAIAEDPTLFPAYNDLGVVEAGQGDLDAARHDFERAAAAAPGYDLATWNLGVLDMRSIATIPAGQALLARAIAENSVLRGESTTELRTDERVYKVALGKGTVQPFNRTYGVAAAALGGISLGGLMLAALVDLGKERGRDTFTEQVGERARRFAALVERRAGRALGGLRARPWTITAPVLIGVTAVVTVWTGEGSGFSTVLIAAYAALLGLLVHETGHLLAAWALRRRVRAVQSPLLLGIAIVMLPLRLLGGPCVGHEVFSPEAGPGAASAASLRRNHIVYLAGPLANLLVALAAGLASLARPLPMLRVILLVQLGMVAFSFLPLEPMEGAVLGGVHRRLVGVFLVALVVVAILFSEGVL